MKRIRILLAAAVAALALTLGAAPASAQYVEGGPSEPDGAYITLSSNTVEAGGSVTVEGGGYAGDAAIRVDLESDPVFLADLTADADGAFRGALTIPADTPLGAHEVVTTGEGADGDTLVLRAALTVVAPGSMGGGGAGGGGGGAIARTGSDVLPLVGIAGAALLLGGAFIYGARKPREA